MEKIILIKPDLSYADEIIKYKEEALFEKAIINSSISLEKFSSVEGWLEELKMKSSEDTVPKGLVPSTTYFAIREIDNYIVGMVDIRHYLNEFLTQVGGNIGYDVRKSERFKNEKKFLLLVIKIILPVKRLFCQLELNLKILEILMVRIRKDFGLIYKNFRGCYNNP